MTGKVEPKRESLEKEIAQRTPRGHSLVTLNEAAAVSKLPALFLRRATGHGDSVGGLPVFGWCPFCKIELFWLELIEYWTDSGSGLRRFREFNRKLTLTRFYERQQLRTQPAYLRASDVLDYHTSDPERGKDAFSLLIKSLRSGEFSRGTWKVLMLVVNLRAAQWTPDRAAKGTGKRLLVSKQSILGWLDDQFGEVAQRKRLAEMWVQRPAYLAWAKNHHLEPNSMWADDEGEFGRSAVPNRESIEPTRIDHRPKRRPGRKKGDGSFEPVDEALMVEMKELMDAKKAASAQEAARMVAPRAHGSGTVGNKADRLARRYREKMLR